MTISMEHLGYIVGIIAVIYGMYQKIKTDCVKKAMEKVAEAEGHSDLSGTERYQLALCLLEKELPGTFVRSLIRNMLSQLINHAYDNSKEFAKGYTKIKTGESIENIIEKLSTVNNNASEDTISDESEE